MRKRERQLPAAWSFAGCPFAPREAMRARTSDRARGRELALGKNDPTAKGWFVGTNCGLCNHTADYEYTEHGL
jgi:hypothetical protein